jgi:glycosyltransferase involved in cell wall biosynthesis
MSNATSYSLTEPSVSVVIPTYNRAHLLGRSVRSVLAQTYADFELVVVDDGSTDGTPEVLKAFGDPRVRYVALSRNAGAGAARNVGIRVARGKFLAFQDSDDEWAASKLSKQMRAFGRGTERLGVVYSDMEVIRADGRAVHFAAPDVTCGRLIDPATRFYQVHHIGIQSAVIRREYLEAAGDFDESLPAFEDMEMFVRLSRLCDFRRLREPLVKYHDTQGISHDPRARWVGRKMLLKLYGGELLTRHPRFLLNEVRWLYARRHEAARAKREGATTTQAAAL